MTSEETEALIRLVFFRVLYEIYSSQISANEILIGHMHHIVVCDSCITWFQLRSVLA
jgi:hypothetical protein